MEEPAEDEGFSIDSCQVLNVVLRWDPVSSFGDRIGKKLRLPNPGSIFEAHSQDSVVKAVKKSGYKDQTSKQVYDALWR